MIENPLPQWVRDRCQEHIDGYLKAAQLCRGHLKVLEATFPKRRGFLPADSLGTYDDYRFDALYCEGQAERLAAYLRQRQLEAARETLPAEEPDPRERPSKEQPRDPEWSEWKAPWRKLDPLPLPDPLEALQMLKPMDAMAKFTPQEAEALILCYSLRMKPREAAAIIECSPRTVIKRLQSARHKFTENDGKGA